MDIHVFLATVWYLLLCLLLGLYVVTGGYDLGVGILALLERCEGRRCALMAVISCRRETSELWLLLFGGALFGAFPSVYSIAVRTFYIPVGVMLFGLILRGVAFRLRAHAAKQDGWALAFGAGSLLAALAQGYALGGVVGGLATVDGVHASHGWVWSSAFATVTAIGVAAGYALLGGTYLIMKSKQPLRAMVRRRSRYAAWIMLSAAAFVSVATPVFNARIAQRWLMWPDAAYLTILSLAALGACAGLMRALSRDPESAPFLWSLGIFALSFVGLATSLYPYLVPPELTITRAASSSTTLVFMLVGIGMLIPAMLVYSAYQYRVFGPKTVQAARDVARRRASPADSR